MVLGYSSFGEIVGSSISQQYQSNMFSGQLVLAALAIIATMILDRLAYLLRSHVLKLIVQIATVIGVHVFVFFVLPVSTERTFAENPLLIGFYLMWCVYLTLRALQLHNGYDESPPRFSLLRVGFSEPIPTLLYAYLAIPFLHELRVILDWVCSTTSMDLGWVSGLWC